MLISMYFSETPLKSFRTQWILSIVLCLLATGLPLFAQNDDPDSDASKRGVTLRFEALKEGAGEMVLIEGGTYEGAAVNSFHMDVDLVTVEQYEACIEAHVCPPPPDNGLWGATYNRNKSKQRPINETNWFNAKTYCEWLGKRLPTEREWEWAARGREEGRLYPWGNKPPTRESACWMRYDGETDTGQGPCEVGLHNVSRDGVKDLAGNLWEWTSTYYDAQQTLIVLKGGAWYNDVPARLLVKTRGKATPYNTGAASDGFRCVRDAR
ncbi:MAG: formylglycine-generating enzyme family protein [Thermoanaerobaculia bacterium]|nr:formylglycine-generating enzyme family protein [Thermoanaerobaculia bacterium]